MTSALALATPVAPSAKRKLSSWRALLAFVLATALSSCSSNDPRPTGSEVDKSGDNSVHVVFQDSDWTFKEAVKPLGGPGPLATAEPSLDWFAEYERFVPVTGGEEGLDLLFSGHSVGLLERDKELRGIELTHGNSARRPASWGAGPEGKPAIVNVAFEKNYTVTVQSYALSLDEVRAVAARLVPVTQAQWREHGGEILDCALMDPACAKGGGE